MAKKQIHPMIDTKDLETFAYFGLKPSQAIHNHAKLLRNGTDNIDKEIQIKQGIMDALKLEVEQLNNKISDLENEISQLENQRKTNIEQGISNYETAKKVIEKRFNEVLHDLNSNKWNVEKMKIKELESIASEYGIPPDVLLTDYPRSLLYKVLENYRKYS